MHVACGTWGTVPLTDFLLWTGRLLLAVAPAWAFLLLILQVETVRDAWVWALSMWAVAGVFIAVADWRRDVLWGVWAGAGIAVAAGVGLLWLSLGRRQAR